MRIPVALLLALAALSACIAAPSVFHGDKGSPLLALPDTAGVVVGRIAVGDPAEEEALQAALVEALLAANMPATLGGGNVASRFVSASVPEGGEREEGGDAPVVWELRDAGDRLLRAFKQPLDLSPLPGGTAPADRARLNRARLGEVAETVAALVRAGADPSTEATTAPDEVRLLPITGLADRDGDALATAVRATLAARGVAIAGEDAADALLLFGDVTVTAESDAMRHVEIVWTLAHADGVEVGTARQANRVPASELAGGWAPIAPLVAEAVADGILALLDEARAAR